MADSEFVFRMLDWVIDPTRGQLRRSCGAPVAIGPRPFQVLVTLARRPAEVLTFDDLLERVWRLKDDRHLCADAFERRRLLVKQTVKRAREAVGDDAKAPRYIAFRRADADRPAGYAMVAPVVATPRAAAYGARAAVGGSEIEAEDAASRRVFGGVAIDGLIRGAAPHAWLDRSAL